MLMKKCSFILIFILFSKSLFSAFYFSENTNNVVTNISKETNIIKTNEILNTDFKNHLTNTSVRLEMEGNTVITQSNILISQVDPIKEYKTSALRYTEVTFFLTIAFAYTYAGLAVYGFNSIENNFIISAPLRAPYKKMWVSSTAFEVFTGVACAISVAYDSYQRIYGKKKEGSLSFNFVPFYDAVNKDAGFYFTLNYPYRF